MPLDVERPVEDRTGAVTARGAAMVAVTLTGAAPFSGRPQDGQKRLLAGISTEQDLQSAIAFSIAISSKRRASGRGRTVTRFHLRRKCANAQFGVARAIAAGSAPGARRPTISA